MDDNRKKALAQALGQIEKQFGKGSVMRMGDGQAARDIEAISTGSIGLDVALGIGGLPKGRVVEVYGPESSGKTTLTLQVVAEAQKMGGTAAFVDAEHALDAVYAKALGVDTDNLLVSQPDSGEQALEIARRQQARSLELRAARDLVRLWAERGERQRALDLLTPVCDWFTEGFDTADLIEAKALLDNLR